MLARLARFARRAAVLALPAAVAAVGLSGPAAAQRYPRPALHLQTTQTRDQGIAREADWYSARYFEGIGWKLGTVSRGGGDVMTGGYTVVHPAKGEPRILRNCFVLAAFDLLPRGVLCVTVRDPQFYWEGYDIAAGVTDPVELVWYDDEWQEQYAIVLDYAAGEYPDDFVLAPKQNYLLAVRHPVEADGGPAQAGHGLNIIYLSDGTISDVWLPEADGVGQLPLSWWPVLLGWTPKCELMVQAGDELRTYSIEW